MADYRDFPVTFDPHAAMRLLKRFGLDADEAEHYVRTARIVKPIVKDGNYGYLRSRIGDCNIEFRCTTRRGTLHVKTVCQVGNKDQESKRKKL